MSGRPSSDWAATPRGRARAKHQLKREPLCAYCLCEGRYVAATHAHHKDPHQGDWHKWATGELISLCTVHHNRTAQQHEHKAPQVLDVHGWPVGGDVKKY